ncbi:MAG TPA: RNA polymerase sigma factor [Firmicutes bacterium]|nr:RNA polymerase sigma factor [Bacillota bacterium]
MKKEGRALEQDILRALVNRNDNDARRDLFEAYYRRTYAVVYNILRSREAAEDITQDAFIRAFRNLKSLQDGAKFGAWLAVIASNLARNHLKREKRIYLTDDLPSPRGNPEGSDTEEEVIRGLETERVRKAIRALPPEQYQVIVLQYYHDLKMEEIAALLKIRPGTVKSRLFRARRRLADLLELDQDDVCLTGGGGDRK